MNHKEKHPPVYRQGNWLPNYLVTIPLSTIGELQEGGLIEEMIEDICEKIAEEIDTESRIFLARRIVALSDLDEAITESRWHRANPTTNQG